MAVLHQRDRNHALRVFRIGSITRIGRSDECQIVLDSRDVSRQHAQIIHLRRQYVLEDLQSRNGTQVNDTRVSGPLLLSDCDKIEICARSFAFCVDDRLVTDSETTKPALSTIQPTDSRDFGLRLIEHIVVRSGDQISAECIARDSLVPDRILCCLPAGDAVRAHHRASSAGELLHQVLQLQSCLRNAVTQGEVMSAGVHCLFDLFPTAEKICVILADAGTDILTVEAVATRRFDDAVRVCIPLVVSAMEDLKVVLYRSYDGIIREDSTIGQQDAVIRILLCTSLVDHHRCSIGAIHLENFQTEGFSRSDAERLAVFGQVFSCSLDTGDAADSAARRAVLEFTNTKSHVSDTCTGRRADRSATEPQVEE